MAAVVEQDRNVVMNAHDDWLTALREQASCYRRLAKLAETQHEHVEQNRTDALLAVLEARQAELMRVGALENAVGPVRREWARRSMLLPQQQKREAESLFGEIRALLETITASDRNDSLILQQRKLDVGQQLKQASAARQVNRNYAAAAYGRPVAKVDLSQ